MAAADGTSQRAEPVLIGRRRELEVLGARLRSALAGDGQLVLLAGEPGIGKTRLAEETVAVAAGLGLACRWGRAVNGDGGRPFSIFRQVLRGLTGPGQDSPLDATAARWSPSADAHVGRRVAGEVPGQERFEMFEAVVELLVEVGAAAGLLLVLDDLQWADPASLQLLLHLTRALPGSRLLVVGTYRDTETGGREAFRQALAELAREPVVTRLHVVGLAEAEVAAQLAVVTGRVVSDPVAVGVSRRTRGNPFFVGEVAHLLQSCTTQDDEAVARQLPEAVRDAVHARLAQLGDRCRSVLCTAAVVGPDVDIGALSALTGHPVAEILTALDEASAAGVLTPARPWRFTHDLVREVARAELGTATRTRVHLEMARLLETRADVAGVLPELAFHWLESLPLGDTGRAVACAERAAEQAMTQLAWEDAAALLGRALHAARAAPAGLFRTSDLCRLLLARARAQARGYDIAGARQSLLDLVGAARPAGDGEAIGHAALTMEGLTDTVWGATGTHLCEEALGLLPPADSALRARLLAQLTVDELVANTPSSSAERREAPVWESLSRAALGMAERVGDHAALVAALRARQMARSGPDGTAERLALGDRMLAIGEQGDADAALWGRLWRFDALAQLGHIDRAESELDRIASASERLRSPLGHWHLTRSQGAIAVARGRFPEAVSLGQEAIGLAEKAGHEGAVIPSLGFLALVCSLTGARELPLDRGQQNTGSAFTAIWHLAVGRHEDARRIYVGLPPPTAVPGFFLLSYLGAVAVLAEAFDDRTAAADVLNRLAPFAELFLSGGAGVIAVWGSVHLPMGLAAGTLGHVDEAVGHLRAAVAANDRAGCPPFTATSRYHLARVLARRRRPGDREEAAALGASAESHAAQLGMAPLRRQAGQLSASLAGGKAGPLTRREEEIAALVAQGLTNRQVAAVTHIAERTAENHVGHILTKLGFVNRAQIAAWVARGRR